MKDIKIKDNDLDFVYSEFGGDMGSEISDNRHIQDIISSFPGYWKETPLIGVGIDSYVNSKGKTQELEKKIRVNLESDKWVVDKLSTSVTGSDVQVEIEYKKRDAV